MLAWLVLAWSMAQAATAVLYTGSPEEAEARVRKLARVKGEITLHRLIELAPGASPYVIGEPPGLRCAPGRLESVREGVENALASLDRSKEALTALDLARLDLECLGEAVDPGVAAQLFYLRGFVSWRIGNAENAESAFYRAFLFSPMITWDVEMGGPHTPKVFQAAEARARGYDQSWLRILPELPPGFALRIDGQPREPEGGRVALRPGVHLVQVIADGHVDQPLVVPLVDDEEKVLVLPIALSEAMLGRLPDPAVRDALGVLIAAAWPGEVVHVTGPAGTWTFDPGGAGPAGGGWTQR